MIIVNGWNPSTIITKYSILDVAAALDPPLHIHDPSQAAQIELLTLLFFSKSPIVDICRAR